MKLLKIYSFLFSLLLLTVNGFSQSTTTDDAGKNFMYGNGKIFVVVAVVVVIVIGLFIYLINIDRKISKLEKKE